MADHIVLRKTAAWNPRLINSYRDRWAEYAGRYWKVSAQWLGGLWWVEEVDRDGKPFFDGNTYASPCGHARNLASARVLIRNLATGCGCMTERDPLGGPDRVLTHSATCPEHPDYEETL